MLRWLSQDPGIRDLELITIGSVILLAVLIGIFLYSEWD